MKTYWVYILRCDNDSLYTGYTDNLVRRYQAHLKGTGSKYTRSFKPVSIAQCWEIKADKSLAMQLERQIKAMSRAEKDQLIHHPARLLHRPEIKPGVLPSEFAKTQPP